MKKRIAILFSIAVMLTAGVIFAMAQSGPGNVRGPGLQGAQPPPLPPPPPPFMLPRLDRMARDLNLTQAQLSELKAFFDAERSILESMMKKLDGQRRQLDETTANGQFDEAQVRAMATQQAQTLAELIVAHKRAEARIYSVLTPEQRARFQELRQRRGPPPPPPCEPDDIDEPDGIDGPEPPNQ